MKIGIFKTPLAATALLLVLSATAQAQDTFDVDCTTLEGLNTTMAYLTFASDATTLKDREGLQGKLDEAQAKLDEDKVCDAGLKISDFNDKVFSLVNARKTKIGESAPGALKCALEGSQALSESWLAGCDPVSDPPRGKGPKNK